MRSVNHASEGRAQAARGNGPAVQPLILDVVSWTNDLNWQWRLSEPDGTELAFATVALDNFEPEYEGFVDLRSYLRLRAGSQRRTEDEATLMAQVGRWISQA